MCYVWILLLLVQFPGVVDSIEAVTDSSYQTTCSSDSYTFISESSGTLREPQNETFYGGGRRLACYWVIGDQSNNKDVVFLNLTYLDIADGDSYGDCVTDKLVLEDTFLITIHDSIDYCGNVSSPILHRGISNSRKVSFFTSRESPIGTGFELHWFYAPICSNGPVVIPIDSFSPELTPMPWPWYDGTDDCQYHISVSGKAIRLTVSELSVEDNSCSTDYLEVVNANDPTEVWWKFCKAIPNPRSYNLPGPAALITHHKVSDIGYFRLTWGSHDVIGKTEQQRMYDAIASGCAALVGTVIIILVIALKCAKSSPYYYKRGEVSIGSQTISVQSTSPIPPTVPPKALPHIMISYQWDVKEAVLKFKEQLVKAGYRVWIDVEWMHKHVSTFDAMTDAIENAAVVVPVLTAKYQESVNCRKEIEFADKSKKPIVAVRFEKKFKPTKWLSFLLGNSLWHDLSNPKTYHDQLQNFLDAIEANGALAKISPSR